jgi:hypothetical protein
VTPKEDRGPNVTVPAGTAAQSVVSTCPGSESIPDESSQVGFYVVDQSAVATSNLSILSVASRNKFLSQTIPGSFMR